MSVPVHLLSNLHSLFPGHLRIEAAGDEHISELLQGVGLQLLQRLPIPQLNEGVAEKLVLRSLATASRTWELDLLEVDPENTV